MVKEKSFIGRQTTEKKTTKNKNKQKKKLTERKGVIGKKIRLFLTVCKSSSKKATEDMAFSK